MLGKRGQVGVEYLVISAVAISIAVGGWFVVQDTLERFNDQIQIEKLETGMNQFVTAAQEIAYLGEGARQTLDIDMPENLNYVRVIEDQGNYFMEISLNTSAGEQRRLYDLPVEVRVGSPGCTEGS